VKEKMHWVLCEAINTSFVLFKVTGVQKYFDDYNKFREFAKHNFIDFLDSDGIKPISWIHELDENNNFSEKTWNGKPDIYHAVQAMLIPEYRIDYSIASAIYLTNKAVDRLSG